MSDAVSQYREAFESARGSRPGAGLGWLETRRGEALEYFERTGFPQPRDEHWKYTRVGPIASARFELPQPAAATASPAALLDLGGPRLVFVDGRLAAATSVGAATGDGVTISSLAEALTRVPERVAPHLNACADPHAHAFTALNTALSDDGAFVHVSRDARLAEPLHLLFVASGEREVMIHPRILLVADEGSELTVVEHYIAVGDSRYFDNVVTEASVGANASLTHYKLQRESTRGFHVSTLAVRQHADSRFVSHSVSLGAALSRHDINVALHGRGAECTLNGLYMASGRQHVDYHTLIDHQVPSCTSREDYKGVLGGRARGVFNGRVVVQEHAQKTDASQSNRNLLLSADAEIDTKPQLEIFADDVKCAHGATVGQLDERMVFYLRSRGLDEASARALLTYGFARDIVDRMGLEPLRDIVAEALLDELPHASQLRSMLS